MKKVIAILFAISVLLLSLVSASSATVDISQEGQTIYAEGDWVYEAIDGGAHWEIDSYQGNSNNLVIPRIVNNMMVVSIGSHCFLNNNTVESVETSSPLWSVGEYSFMNCTSLESFECNFALKEIGVGAFLGTTSLSEINLEASVVTVIRPHVFSNSGISEVTLPETCTEIMHDAFAQCSNLEKIVIPRSVTTIDDKAFTNSNNLTIYCYTDSAAHQFALQKDIPFVLLDPPTEPPYYLLGDVNDDSSVDPLDATLILRYCVNINIFVTQESLMHGDVDGDEEVSVIDATLILRYSSDMRTKYQIGEKVYLS